MGVVELIQHPLLGVLIEHQGLQVHGAGLHAAAAADALGVGHGLFLVLAEGQHGAGALAHGNICRILGHTHHGAAHDELIGAVLQAAAGVKKTGHGSADGTFNVLGLHHTGAGHGDDLAHHGHAGGNGPEDGAGGVDVEDGAADVAGQAAGRDLLAGDGLAELLLTALGVAAVQGLHHHGGALFPDAGIQGVDAVLLVVLDANDHLVHAEHFGEIGGAADDLLRPLQHGAVVAGDVGLALGAVDDDGVHLADTAGDLHVGGEGSAAHTDDTCILDDLHHLVDGEGVRVRGGLDLFTELVLEIVFDDHGCHIAAHGIGTGLHSLDRTGNAGVDRGAQTAELTDLLTNLHMVANLDKRRARCTEVHRHGDDHLCRGCQLFDGLFIGRGLHVMGMNAAKESLCHCLHLIFTPDSARNAGPPRHRLGRKTHSGHTTTYCASFYTKNQKMSIL